MSFTGLTNSCTGKNIATSVLLADSFWLRLRGLLGRPPLKPYEGLWLIPCQQVHMYGMHYPLSIWFISSTGRVCHIIDQLEPGKISPRVREAVSIIEFPAGWAEKTDTHVGDIVQKTAREREREREREQVTDKNYL